MTLSNHLPRTVIQSVLSVGLLLSATAVQAETFILNIFLPPTHFTRGIMQEWATEVEKATDGRVSFEIPAGSLAPPAQQFNAVKNGIADLAITADFFIEKQAPLLQFSSLPFMISDAGPASVAHYRTYNQFLADKGYFKGTQFLSSFHFGGGHLYSLGDEVNSKAALKQSKVWALPGSAAVNIKDFGLSPITSPAVKVGEPVARGVVDVVYGISPGSVVDFKASAYVKHITRFPKATTSTSFSLFMSDRAWKKIAKDDQAIVMGLAGETLSAKVGKAAQQVSDDAMNIMTAAGVKVHDASEAFYTSLQNAAKPQLDAFNRQAEKVGLEGAEIIEYFQQQYDAVK